MQGTHDPTLVALSVLVAILASYAALDLAGRVGHRSRRLAWIVGGSIAMGSGIWSMHYVAMLALRMPIPMVYDIGLLILSLVVAVGAAAVAFSIIALASVSRPLLFAAAGVMGAAIAGMHYIGMWALAVHTPARQSYDPLLVAASLLVAYVASLAALWLAFYFRTGAPASFRKVGASVLMGFAISGMHYTAMAAVTFIPVPGGTGTVPEEGVLGTPTLAVLVAAAAVLVLVLGITGAAVDRGFARAINRTEARFRLMVENVSEVITLMSGDGVATYVSPAVERVLGYTPAERVGRSLFDLVHPDDRETVRSALEEGLRDHGGSVEVEARLRHKDGSWPRIESVGRNLLDQPDVQAVILTSRDITARHQLEEQLARSQRMEAVGRLAGGVAHDFNNLVTVIKGHAQFALEASEHTDPQHAELLGVLDAAERAAALTAQLLAFSRRQVREPKLIDLNGIVTSSERLLSRVIAEDVQVEADLAEGLDGVMADPGQIEQVLMNLVVNARDAIPDGGRITIQTRDVILHEPVAEGVPELTSGRYVVLSVRDTGVGMTPADLAHIFEPFFTTKSPGKGTGLGLATVYGIVNQSEGAIRVTSTAGRGSTFEVFLPSAGKGPAKLAQESDTATPARPQQDRTILIVEDEDPLRDLLVRTLRKEGYTVLDAEGPDTALRLAQQYEREIHLLVSDVVMPGGNGVEFAHQLRNSRPETRVLFISGYASDEVLRRDGAESDAPFLSKPFMPAELAARVHDVLSSS